MNEELQKQLTTYVQKIGDAGEAGADFIIANAPETVRQYLEYKFWNDACVSVLCLIAAVAILVCFVKYIRGAVSENCVFDDLGVFLIVVFGLPGVVGLFIFSFCNASSAAKIKLAPNIVILEKAAEIARGK